jgi:two-component system cell cycle sensor histidine kinase/response regulator CckA
VKISHGEKIASLPPGEYLCLTVRDEGAGISPEDFPFIFEPFFTTRSWTESTGLGLSSARGIVRKCGGDILVSRAPEQGTLVQVYLPTLPLFPSQVPHFPVDSKAPAVLLTRDTTIMVVDDEAGFLELTQRALEHHGYRVTLAKNGVEALKLLDREEEAVSLVLVDLIMPEMGGSELARKITKKHPTLPLIFYSGYSPESLPDLPEGHRFLKKPCPLSRLLATIQEVMEE